MKKLNVGMIGGGFMGKAHALAYAGMPMFLASTSNSSTTHSR